MVIKTPIPVDLPKEITNLYTIERNTFITKDAGDVYNKFELEIGDLLSDEFQPQLKIKRWDNECNFSVRLIDDGVGVPTVETETNKIKFIESKTEVHFYNISKTEAIPECYEFEVILKEKPKTNKVQMSIMTKGLEFYYQPELTQEEIDDGAFRPENVIGSYAVYHESKAGDYSRTGKKNYRAGKAFHIYRPKIIDNAGKEVWGKLNIDVKKKLLTIVVPQVFLDNAVYPVIVDPTFGYVSAGASFFECDIDRIRTRIGNPGENGTAVSISASVRKALGASKNMQGALYLTSDASLLSPQTAENLVSNTNQHWEVLDFTNGPAVSNQNYDIAVFFDNPDDSNKTELAYDSGGVSGDSKYSETNAENYNSWPSTYSLTNSSSKYSVYCTYTVGVAPTSIFHGPLVGPFGGPI